jgi:Alpha-glutamyl/putrescinyl thymine pyrophosphorylase clade 2
MRERQGLRLVPGGLAGLHADYARFHRIQVASRDIDPVYPVYRQLAADLGLTAEDRTRLVLLHVAYYHAGSALAALDGAHWRLPCGTERRGHRDDRQLRRHLDGLAQAGAQPGGYTAFLRPRAGSWDALTARLRELPGNGRWAAYKAAEMLQKVCGYAVTAPDMGHAHSSGPRHGLALLYPGIPEGNSPADIARLDAISAALAAGLPAPVEEAETTLCDFHAMHGGRYYPGHDIDVMLAQLIAVQSGLTAAFLAARRAVLPPAYLGEIHGWSGVDRGRCRAYRDTGQIRER